MSRENVELIQRAFEAFNRRDLDAFLELMDPAFRVEPGEIGDHGDVTLAHGRLRGEGASSGVAFDRVMWHIARWRGKKQVWWSAFETEAEALEAAGLRE